MNADENKALVRRFYDEVLQAARQPALDRFVADELRSYKESIRLLRAAFRDLRWSLEGPVAEGDVVTQRWTLRGTHKLSATPVSGSGVSVFRIAGGKIVEHRGYSDPELQRQLDALPLE